MTCSTCRYYQEPEGVCIVRCDWVSVTFPEQHRCKRWQAKP